MTKEYRDSHKRVNREVKHINQWKRKRKYLKKEKMKINAIRNKNIKIILIQDALSASKQYKNLNVIIINPPPHHHHYNHQGMSPAVISLIPVPIGFRSS